MDAAQLSFSEYCAFARSKFIDSHSQDILVYRHTYWKMTNLNNNWGSSARSADLC